MTEVTNFSDSEDEADGIVVPEQLTISAEEFEDEIKTLQQVLATVKTSTAEEIRRIEAQRTEEKELFAKERAHHAEELLKRQSRIDFLMDKMISK